MPIIDFTEPFYVVVAVILFVLCLYLARNNRSNTVACIVLLTVVTLLVGHTIELSNAPAELVHKLSICILVDELFTFVSFLSFLWLDRIEVDSKKNNKSGKSNKKNGKERLQDKVIEDDGLNVLWKKV